MSRIKNALLGKPLTNKAISGEKYSILWGLPILASDAVSSVAYASEEILLVLIPAIGYLAYGQLSILSSAIIVLLVLLVLSYRQTIERYPNGGGAFVVAKENIGVTAGVAAGSALAVDYTLTVAVSISAGVAAIISAFPFLFNFRVILCLVFLLIIMIGNLRGVRESARLFSIPTYAFVIGILFMIIYGIYKVRYLGYVPPQPSPEQLRVLEPITLFLILRAFSSGCAAVTGIEAVSNSVPNFKEPSAKNAKMTLTLLGLIVFVCFGGTSLLANIYHVVPIEHKTVLSQIANEIFGKGFMFYYIQATTAIILAMAANTAYSGFPLLMSVMAGEGYVPRQLTVRGDRLSYSNGIILLTCLAALLIVLFNGDTHLLIPLYAVGVFMSFTLSQSGMFMKWLRSKDEKNRVAKAMINGTGAFVTGIATIVIGGTKFVHGAWIVVIVIPILISLCLMVKRHYTAIACQLRIEDDELSKMDISSKSYKNHVIVPISSLNKASVRALKFARTISHNVVAFNVAINEEDAKKVRQRWKLLKTDIRLVIKYSPFRKIIEPLLKFIESEEHEYQKGDMITVVLPKFSVIAWWHVFLHNHTRFFIENKLLKHKHIVVATMPLQLKKDDIAIGKYKKGKCDL